MTAIFSGTVRDASKKKYIKKSQKTFTEAVAVEGKLSIHVLPAYVPVWAELAAVEGEGPVAAGGRGS